MYVDRHFQARLGAPFVTHEYWRGRARVVEPVGFPPKTTSQSLFGTQKGGNFFVEAAHGRRWGGLERSRPLIGQSLADDAAKRRVGPLKIVHTKTHAVVVAEVKFRNVAV